MISATPKYIDHHAGNYDTVPPGHRFNLYFPIWNESSWEKEDREKSRALKKTLHVPRGSIEQINALRNRQMSSVFCLPDEQRMIIETESTGPMVTGMGIEHPLENGFAFLSPYGMPYLPGSSIKGVLRRAAEELLEDEEPDWNQDLIDILFGREANEHDKNSEHLKGAITFWDSIPEIKSMGMDVMTPHYSDYYQGKSSPHDAGSPNPIVFMVVPAQSSFSFYLTADISLLPKTINWQPHIRQAFEHAFKWLGFGAKTSVGYGAMKILQQKMDQQVQEAKDKKKDAIDQAERAKLSPIDREIQDFISNWPSPNPGIGLFNKLKQGAWENTDDQMKVAEKIKQLWETSSTWNPDFKGTNKKKVQQKTRCQEVRSYLND